MVLESLGVPVGVLATENYEINNFISSQSYGFHRQRRIVLCDQRRIIHSNATPTSPGYGTMTPAPTTGVNPRGLSDESDAAYGGQYFLES